MNNILPLNQQEIRSFLETLGYQDGERIYYRIFSPPNAQEKKARSFSLILPNIPKFQEPDVGLYLVVNGGGNSDKDIKKGRALFFEYDDLPIEEQLIKWQKLNLPQPTLQVITRKSVHSYYVFSEPIEIDSWRKLQVRLLEYTQSDRTLKNPSRVMRIPGSWHIKPAHEPLPVRLFQENQNEKIQL